MDLIRIFGYGSLINQRSLRKTVPNPVNIYPAKVFGFRRIFNIASHYRYCAESQSPVCVLNLERTAPDIALNGICFEMDAECFEALMSREQIYQTFEVMVQHYFDDQNQQNARLFWAKDHSLHKFLANSEAQQHYLNLCIEGCERYGNEFLNHFKNSTGFWGLDPERDVRRIWRGSY